MSQVKLTTNHGDILIELDAEKAPLSVANFLSYVRSGHYDGTVFHRVIKGFMIQGGDPTGTGRGGPGYRFADELPKAGQYEIGSVAMANAGPGTNGSQFFVTVGPTPHLNMKHTIFGEVADQSSRDVVDAIGTTRTGAMDRPAEPVTIESVTIER